MLEDVLMGEFGQLVLVLAWLDDLRICLSRADSGMRSFFWKVASELELRFLAFISEHFGVN